MHVTRRQQRAGRHKVQHAAHLELVPAVELRNVTCRVAAPVAQVPVAAVGEEVGAHLGGMSRGAAEEAEAEDAAAAAAETADTKASHAHASLSHLDVPEPRGIMQRSVAVVVLHVRVDLVVLEEHLRDRH